MVLKAQGPKINRRRKSDKLGRRLVQDRDNSWPFGGEDGLSETPRHDVMVRPFSLDSEGRKRFKGPFSTLAPATAVRCANANMSRG